MLPRALKSNNLNYRIARLAFQFLAAAALILQSVSANVPAQAAGCISPADCLSKMTLDEKIGQMTQANKNALTMSGNSTSDITTYFLGSLLSGGGEGPNSPASSGGTATQWADMYDSFQNLAVQTRLGIPLIYGVDAVHGHNNVSGAVIFPHNIGMGATRDAALVQQEEAVTRDEVLGTGMNWVFAPCVCVPQDDRWGRTYEGFGENTSLVQSMAAAAVQGFQGSGLSTTTVMATAKHYVGDGGTTFGTGSSGYLIDQGNTQIDEATLRAIHLPPFQTAVANNVGSVMISYSSWNGVKMHGNQYLITTVLKGELGFKGIVVSDWAGIDAISSDYPTAVRTAINAGVDMVMVPTNYKTFISTLRTEVNAGRVPLSRIDDAVTRILTQKFALGLFSKFKTDRSYTSQVGSAAHRAVARQAVRESQVLLKNDGVLPLSKTATYKIVVGGSHVDDLGSQMGGWAITWQGGTGNTTTGTTFWQAIQAAKPANVTLQNVGTSTASSYTGDVGIAVVGEAPYAEGKGDSSSLALNSTDATQVSDICSRTTKCIVVLMSGRPLIVNTQVNLANAFIAAWLPGTEGAGMTDVLFGDFNFTGKLPLTWPNAISQEPINGGDGKTGLFPFDFGLTYGTNPTPTNTQPGPTATITRTNTPLPPTATRTNTPPGPTATNTIGISTNTPTGTNTPPGPTNTPVSGSLIVQINKGNGVDNTQETGFNFLLKNTGSSAVSNLSTRIYFDTDGSNAGSGYVLEKYYDQSGVATYSGPTLACGSTYYFTVTYGTASLAAGGQWEIQTALHLSSWASTYSGANDFYHGGYAVGALPVSYTTTGNIPAYVSGAISSGSTPCGSGPTSTSTAIIPTATRTNTPIIIPTITPSNTATRTNTPVIPTLTSTLPGPTATRTNTVCPAVTGTVRQGSSTGPGLAGVLVTGTTTGFPSITGTTDSTGFYVLGGCSQAGMVVSAQLSGFTFAPAQQTVNGMPMDFVATATTGTATNTPPGPTATRTNTPIVPTATNTNTPLPPTATRTPTPTVGASNTPVPPTVTPGGSDPCASPTVITAGGSFAITTSATCFKYVNAANKWGGMFTVMNGSSTAANTLKWYGGRSETVTSCINDSQVLSGNGAQLNNFTVAKDSTGAMYLTVTGTAANTISLSIQNWQNGTGCSAAPTPHP